MTTTDSQLDVDELLQRVRQEVERRRLAGRMHGGAPPAVVEEETAASWHALNEAIGAAESSTTVGMRLPPMTQMRGLRRRVAVPVGRLILRAAQLVTRDQSAFNRLILELVHMLTDTVRDTLTSVSEKVEALTTGVAQAIAQSRPVPELVEAGVRTASEMRALRERVNGLDDAATRLASALEEMGRRLEDVRRTEEERRSEAERLRAEYVRTLASLERSLGEQVVKMRSGGPASEAAAVTEALDDVIAHRTDPLYVSFEDRFRGTREDVKKRMGVYLPIIVEARAGTHDRPLLDVGCGRGEWLELLRENGLVARGIDLNRAMVLESRARGLEVSEAEVLAYLESLPPASVGAVTGMHVLEHVEFPAVVRILDECLRVLCPGGVAIFETPNPRNLVVGACQFYIDPTHRTPLHPDTVAFVAESRGLVRVRIMPLHPVEEGRLSEADSPTAKLLNEYFFGPQDFALVGYRS